jgi:preprotein translocase subunit SecB
LAAAERAADNKRNPDLRGKQMTENTTEQGEQTAFNLQKVYVKDVSFESPMSPHIFTKQAAPNVDVQMQIEHDALDEADGFYEVVLTVTVTARIEEQVGFLAEVHQGGIFQIKGTRPGELPMVLEIACPNILLPFVRESIADLVQRGGFPQLLISPINFEALYRQKAGESATEAAAPAN